jgi:dTDP-4-dehydrorhamnose 3,5-epimerase
MKILEVQSLAIPEIKVITFARFADHRGFFAETFRTTDFDSHPQTSFLNKTPFLQGNESFSRAGTIRGLHFQWNPLMGKLVRTIFGHMVDVVLDLRKGSPTFGFVIAYDMPSDPDKTANDWIWIPPGFAHGNVFLRDSQIEYLCSGVYNQECEAGVSPLSADLNWSICDPRLKESFDEVASRTPLITTKDRNAPSVGAWAADPRSANFVFGEL